MFTDFILVRHGETSYNKEGILQGWTDVPLNETGKKQAEKTAEILKKESFDEVWFSDLQRAADTASAILKYHPGVPAYPNPSIREWHLGILENKPYEMLRQEFSDYAKMLRTELVEMPVPGGESRGDFQKRINNAFQDLAERSPGKRCLIVTHGGVLVRLFRMLGGEIPRSGTIPVPGNASVSRIRYDHDAKQWIFLEWNQVYSDVQDHFLSDAPPL